jgi:hypothetical protein
MEPGTQSGEHTRHTFTMPLTLVDLVTKYWSLGPNQVSIWNFLTMPLTIVDLVTKYLSLGPNQVSTGNLYHASHPS